MKQLVLVITAVMAMTGLSQATQQLIENQRTPANRITLPNGVVRVVTSVVLPHRGKWLISGGATVQVNVNPQVSGFYIYTLAAFTTNPNVLPLDGTVGLDSRRYDTVWIPANPKPHSILIEADGGTRVYLVVEYYGQVPAELVEAFGSIAAVDEL